LSMDEAIEKLYKIGAEAKRKIGEQTDDQLLKAIRGIQAPHHTISLKS